MGSAWRWIALLAIAAIAVPAVVVKARLDSADPSRCGEWLVRTATRCCAPGQAEEGGRCTGTPTSCPPSMKRTYRGCVHTPERIRIEGGKLRGGSGDWEAEGRVELRDKEIAPFFIDRIETTESGWEHCVREGGCVDLPRSGEPGRPMTGMSFDEAEAYCAFRGGRLPSEDEWTWAASGATGRRYPWGDTGAVCRRGAWGLKDGPCAYGSRGPELAGAHPDGQSPEGVLDLAGNVAEWVRSDRDGRGRVRGGSWASSLATELRGWKEQVVSRELRHPEIGVRCVYSPASAR